MNQKHLKYISVVVLVAVIAMFAYRHLDMMKTIGAALLAIAWIILEAFPFGGPYPHGKPLQWKQAFGIAVAIWAIAGLAAWILF